VALPIIIVFSTMFMYSQTIYFKGISKALSGKMGGKIEFKSMYFSPFSGFVINELYIEDANTDTLLYAKSLEVSLDSYDFKNRKININTLFLEDAFYNLYSINKLDQTNMQHIINYFADGLDKKDTSNGIFFLNAENISVKNLRFKYKRFIIDSVDYGVNFDDIEIYRLDFDAENFHLRNDSMNFYLENLSLKEKSGLQVNNIKGFTIVSSTQISIKNLVAKTPKSHLFAHNFSMNYNKWLDMADFLNKVKFNVDLQLSSVNIEDIGYFASFFKEMNIPTFAQGRVYGPISNLKSKRFQIRLGKSSMIETRFSLQGLPDIDETFLSLDINNLNLNIDDLNAVLALQENNSDIQVPSTINKLKEIKYKGNITGFLTDLVAYGTFNNQNGQMGTDLRYKYDNQQHKFTFSGRLNTKELDLSVLNLSDTIFDKISMKAIIFAEIDSLQEIKGSLEGDIASIGIWGYNYKKIKLEAELNNYIIKSQLLVNDTNIFLNINSTIDFTLNEPYFDLEAELQNAHLTKLKWINRDPSSTLSFKANAQFSSLSLDNFFGELDINNFLYTENKQTINIESFNLFSRKDKNERLIDINSDFLDANFKGKFLITDLIENFNQYGNNYIPSLWTKEPKKISKQNLNFKINLKNTLSTFQIFFPNYIFSDSTLIKGQYDSKKAKYDFTIYSEYCYLFENYIKGIDVEINGDNDELFSNIDLKYLKVSNDLDFHNVSLYNQLKSDSLAFYLSWFDKQNKTEEDAEIMAELHFNPSSLDSISLDIQMSPSFLFVQDSIWFINDAKVKFRGNQTSVENLIINHDNQYLYADGIWRVNSSDSLHVILNNINLAYFPILEQKTHLQMQGITNGDLTLSYLSKTPIIKGNLQVLKYTINKQLLGDIALYIDWENKEKRLNINAVNKVGSKRFESIKCDGFIDIDKQNIDLDLKLNKQRTSFFEPFVEMYITQLKGYVSGELNIKGPFDKIDYWGELDFKRNSFTYNYLGVDYNFSDKITIKKDRFVFDGLKLFQLNGEGGFAEVNGYIKHQNLINYQFFLNIEANNFNILNTKENDNELYYGKGFITGVADITGTHEKLKINVSAKTNKNTYFNIPLSDSEEAVGADFISFNTIDSDVKKDSLEDYKLDLSGVELNFDLEVTPDAEILLIFDQTVGDIVKANGNGNLHMKINTLGEFKMTGNYVIEKGDYLFTLKNIINKKFKINQGSNIKWNGDPYQAYVEIDAIYRLKTPIYDLTLDPEDKERIPVECHLKMKESLLNPDIKFDIKLPSAGDKAKSLISSMDEEEKNKQLLSLLVLNKFYTPDYLRGGEEIGSGNIAGKSASELLSNQLSNWLSQISDDFDIGVNYRPGDDITSKEIELALSTELFNDRVAIDGNVGVGDYKKTNSNVVGNVSINVKVNKKGNVRLRGFNRVNDNELESSSLYTQGVGLYYKEDFDSFKELLHKYWKAGTFQTKKDTIKN